MIGLRKKILSRNHSLWTLFTIAGVLVTIVLFSSVIRPPFWDRDFDSIEWQLHPEVRDRMVNDLIISRRLYGKTLPEVIALLGRGYEDGHCSNWIGYSTMNPYQGLSIDHEVMVISFNPDGLVDSAFIDLW